MKDVLNILFFNSKILVNLIVLLPLVYILRKNIEKRAGWYYLGATSLAFLVCGLYIYWFVTNSFPDKSSWFGLFITNIGLGVPAYVLFVVVMFQGVIKPWNKATREMLKIRGELAILASILSLAHILIYIITYIIFLILKQEYDLGFDILFYWTLALLVFLIPLFITSFKRIRAKMSPLKWNKLHKYSYYFYFLLHLNILFLLARRFIFIEERFENLNYAIGTYISLFIYSTIFIAYTILRIKVSRERKKALSFAEKRKENKID